MAGRSSPRSIPFHGPHIDVTPNLVWFTAWPSRTGQSPHLVHELQPALHVQPIYNMKICRHPAFKCSSPSLGKASRGFTNSALASVIFPWMVSRAPGFFDCSVCFGMLLYHFQTTAENGHDMAPYSSVPRKYVQLISIKSRPRWFHAFCLSSSRAWLLRISSICSCEACRVCGASDSQHRKTVVFWTSTLFGLVILGLVMLYKLYTLFHHNYHKPWPGRRGGKPTCKNNASRDAHRFIRKWGLLECPNVLCWPFSRWGCHESCLSTQNHGWNFCWKKLRKLFLVGALMKN